MRTAGGFARAAIWAWVANHGRPRLSIPVITRRSYRFGVMVSSVTGHVKGARNFKFREQVQDVAQPASWAKAGLRQQRQPPAVLRALGKPGCLPVNVEGQGDSHISVTRPGTKHRRRVLHDSPSADRGRTRTGPPGSVCTAPAPYSSRRRTIRPRRRHATRRVHCPMTFIHSASPATETDKMRSPAAPVLRRLAGDSLLDRQPGARPQPGSGLRSVPAHPANRRRRPSFQISGKGAGFTRTVLGIAAHRYASSEMSDQGKGRQSRLAVPPYFTQAALRRSRCTSDR